MMNDARYEWSIGLQIANMRELSYDIELEQEAKTFLKCDDIEHGYNYRVQLLSPGYFPPILPWPDARSIKQNETALLNDKSFKLRAEFLHPNQTKIGCVDLISYCPIPGEDRNAAVVCLFGPANTDPIPAWILGKPMSRCQDSVKSDSGLCRQR
ncbi:hypothetical protein GCK72_012731 [Caenorhabditis remanei]|uniref:Uncharacterized protein n=1 Tax=Caenorhabditis remanei TaxID=31234 RepID=A0A6A5GLS3_CAERE|nr:hypothetical protein GCK72_012731 [Caenorhabditis remanei]KAF1756278.1 hypothetical protein GCK72_012731 [Caenorhabditis remanei]